MTRSRSGRAPGSDGRRDQRGSERRRDSATDDRTTGGRVTPKGEQTRASRRSWLVRIAAIVFVVLLLISMAVGCAKYDGDQAAFCAELDEVPSFMELSARAGTGTDAEAAATMDDAADQFRGLERLAPRSIRHTVAALGDAAQRIGAKLADGSQTTQYLTIYEDDGSFTEIPLTTSQGQARIGIFYEEMQNHSGTVSAVYSLMNYARDDCGITDEDLDLGMFGYGPAGSFDDGGRVTVPGGFGETVVPDGNGAVIAPGDGNPVQNPDDPTSDQAPAPALDQNQSSDGVPGQVPGQAPAIDAQRPSVVVPDRSPGQGPTVIEPSPGIELPDDGPAPLTPDRSGGDVVPPVAPVS